MSEQRVLQPFAVMAPPTDPTIVEDPEAERFEQDLAVPTDLTYSEWLRANRPQPPVVVPDDLTTDVPEA